MEFSEIRCILSTDDTISLLLIVGTVSTNFYLTGLLALAVKVNQQNGGTLSQRIR